MWNVVAKKNALHNQCQIEKTFVKYFILNFKVEILPWSDVNESERNVDNITKLFCKYCNFANMCMVLIRTTLQTISFMVFIKQSFELFGKKWIELKVFMLYKQMVKFSHHKLLEKNKAVIIHQKNLRILAIAGINQDIHLNLKSLFKFSIC